MTTPKDGQFYATKTLLGCERGNDRNKRLVYCWPCDRPVLVMNDSMGLWTANDEGRLQIILDALNGEGGRQSGGGSTGTVFAEGGGVHIGGGGVHIGGGGGGRGGGSIGTTTFTVGGEAGDNGPLVARGGRGGSTGRPGEPGEIKIRGSSIALGGRGGSAAKPK